MIVNENYDSIISDLKYANESLVPIACYRDEGDYDVIFYQADKSLDEINSKAIKIHGYNNYKYFELIDESSITVPKNMRHSLVNFKLEPFNTDEFDKLYCIYHKDRKYYIYSNNVLNALEYINSYYDLKEYNINNFKFYITKKYLV